MDEEEHVHLIENSKQGSVECPSGFIADPYPGKCVVYADKNSNDICDLSE